jgi:AmpE protein
MKLIALLIGLIIERLATQLFHLRELRWLDQLIDAGFRQAVRFANMPALIPVTILALLLVAPVFLLIFMLGDAMYGGFPYLILAVVVLFFSLGPKDIGEEVDEYCNALEVGDEERISQTAKALIEQDVPDEPLERIHRVEEAVCIQANNRLFAVIFWFVVLGPLGAWAFRVTDLIRRRAVFKATRVDGGDQAVAVRDAAISLHGWLAWIPARLTSVGYAMAGSFEAAIQAWRTPDDDLAAHHSEQSEQLLARVGVAALSIHDREGESLAERGMRGARAANSMVFRLLFIWAAVIAAMTLYGWSV